MSIGTNADGTESDEFCGWCYQKGQFPDETIDEFIERTAPYFMEASGCSQDEAVSFLGALLPHLKHWQGAA